MTDSRPSPGPGELAPPFTLQDASGRHVSLSDFAGRSLILFCYPAAGTPGCTKESVEFSNAADQFAAAGYAIAGLSPDSPEKLATFAAKESLQVTLLSDPDRAVLAAYGAYGEKQNYGRTVMGVIRSTFVIGPDGRIAQAFRNVRATGHVGRVLAALVTQD